MNNYTTEEEAIQRDIKAKARLLEQEAMKDISPKDWRSAEKQLPVRPANFGYDKNPDGSLCELTDTARETQGKRKRATLRICAWTSLIKLIP